MLNGMASCKTNPLMVIDQVLSVGMEGPLQGRVIDIHVIIDYIGEEEPASLGGGYEDIFERSTIWYRTPSQSGATVHRAPNPGSCFPPLGTPAPVYFLMMMVHLHGSLMLQVPPKATPFSSLALCIEQQMKQVCADVVGTWTCSPGRSS